MDRPLEYSAALTGASFLFFEFKKIVQLSLEGLGEKGIKTQVIDGNLFEYKFVSSLKRALPSLIRRCNALDDELKNMLLNEDLHTAKLITLYTIMKTDRLFFEWMDEVISEKLKNGDFQLEKKDINLFLVHKSEQDQKIASFSEQTVKKLQTIHLYILEQAGILADKKKGTLTIPLIDNSLISHLQSIGDFEYISALGYDGGL